MTEEKRTAFAMAAVDFASLFNTAFADPVMGFQIQLTAPQGQSTGGGVQARQHITLVDQAGGKTAVIGGCNTVEKTAEMRTFDQVVDIFEQRYEGTPFPIPPGEYASIVGRFSTFFSSQGFGVATAVEKARSTGGAPGKKSSAGLIIAIVIFLLLAGAGAAYYFLFYNKV